MSVNGNNSQDTGNLKGKEIVLGVCGSIAAYKAPELIRMLRSCGARVTCILTANGARFITALTLSTVSGNRVCEGMFDPSVWDTEHISLARKADIVVLAPASADAIARLAAGRADDLLSSVVLATESPVLVCPAMNDRMWKHPATRSNVKRLEEYGYKFVQPEEGALACGETGTGRLAGLEKIQQSIEKIIRAG